MSQYLKKFQLGYPKLVRAMKECSHHYSEQDLNPYHLESDIWSHTCLVIKELEGTDLEKAAILHDIGKIETRYENHEKKRVRFSGHENFSAFISLTIFKDWDLSQSEKERLFKLIAMHGEPYRLEYEEICKRCTNDPILAHDLFRFGAADHRGRFHDGIDNHVTRSIKADTKELSESNKEVVFLLGLPGSGKTTYIQENLATYIKISRDDLVMDYGSNYNEAWANADQKAVDALLQKCLQNAAKTQSQVVIDMTNLNRKQRTQKLKLFQDFRKKAVVLLPDLLMLRERLKKRQNKTIEESVIKKMIMGFSLPDFSEFDEIEWRFE